MRRNTRDKSRFKERAPDGACWLGPYEVTQGMAGWFVIRTCWVPDELMGGYIDVWDRCSGYFATKDLAEEERAKCEQFQASGVHGD